MAHPEWLSDDELENWKRFSSVLVRLPFTLDAQLQRDSGLTYFEYLVLAVLSDQPARSMRMSELAGLANGSLSRLSHVAKRLESRGLLRRAPCPDDGRYTLAILTDDGWHQVVEAAPGHVGAVRAAVFDALTPEQVAQLGEISRAIHRRIAPDGPC